MSPRFGVWALRVCIMSVAFVAPCAQLRADPILLIASGDTVALNFPIGELFQQGETLAMEWKAVARRSMVARGEALNLSADSLANLRACFTAPSIVRPSLMHIGWKVSSASSVETGVIRYLILPPADTGISPRAIADLKVILFDPLRRCPRENFWGRIPRIDDPDEADSARLVILGPEALTRLSTDAQHALASRVNLGLRLIIMAQSSFDTDIWPVMLTDETSAWNTPFLDQEISGELSEYSTSEIAWLRSDSTTGSRRGLSTLEPSGTRTLFVTENRVMALEYEAEQARLIFWQLSPDDIHPDAIPGIGMAMMQYIRQQHAVME